MCKPAILLVCLIRAGHGVPKDSASGFSQRSLQGEIHKSVRPSRRSNLQGTSNLRESLAMLILSLSPSASFSSAGLVAGVPANSDGSRFSRQVSLMRSAVGTYDNNPLFGPLSGSMTEIGSTPSMRFSRRFLLWVAAAFCLLPLPAECDSATKIFNVTFDDSFIGVTLDSTNGGRIQVVKIDADSPASKENVPPYVYLDYINGLNVTGKSVAEVEKLLKNSSLPLTLTFEKSFYSALDVPSVVERYASGTGAPTGRVNIRKKNFIGDNACLTKTREGDIVTFDYIASIAETGRVFDSTDLSGRGAPFTTVLGRGNLVPGLDLGLLGMCIGEERRIEVPPELASGFRESLLFGVRQNQRLIYQTKLLAIDGKYDDASANAYRGGSVPFD